MGLIKMLSTSVSTTFKDQPIEYFRCDEIPETVLMRPATKVMRNGTVNNATENVISNGSLFDVGVSQCALLIENGKVHDFCIEPGQYRYDSQLEPSLLSGGIIKNIGNVFGTIGSRFKAGGQSTNTMKLFYINTREIYGNKIGIGGVPFRDSEFGFTVKVQGYGNYSYKITNPMIFFENVCGTTTGDFPRSKIDEQLKSELTMAIQPALGKIAAQKIAYDQLINYPKEIGNAVNEEMSAEWEEKRGISIVSVAMASINVDDASAKKIAEFQESRVYTDPAMMGSRLGSSQATAMENAAKNSAGAMTGFMGLGFATQAGGMNAADMYKLADEKAKQAGEKSESSPADDWKCSCGTVNSGKFCSECGKAKPADADGWVCSCGAVNNGKFCSECGKAKPTDNICQNCGYKPEDGESPPKFCPECGTPFNK